MLNLMPLLLLIQPVLEDPSPVPAFDWSAFGMSAIQALIPVVTMLAIWGGRKLVTFIPRGFIPVVAVVMGTAFDFLTAYTSGGVFNPLVGALLGATSTWLWELINSFNEHGLDS